MEIPNGRVLVFATRRNLELLGECEGWFMDGTFSVSYLQIQNDVCFHISFFSQVSPLIFTQLFTILGAVPVVPGDANSKTIVVPLVYALLSSKEEIQYSAVLQAVLDAAEEYGINLRPNRINADFEVAIINSIIKFFALAILQLCYFHLKQSSYRKVQAVGLVRDYTDKEDSTVRDFIHKMCSLAFVPVGDVVRAFNTLKEEAPELPGIEEYVDYFGETYVIGIPARGRRRRVAPRYHPRLWNTYQATMDGKAATNNAEEGWHNRFSQMVGLNHPDIYTLINELKKEQGDTEIIILEHKMGRKVKSAPKKKWFECYERLRTSVATYPAYGILRILEYLTLISHHVTLD